MILNIIFHFSLFRYSSKTIRRGRTEKVLQRIKIRTKNVKVVPLKIVKEALKTEIVVLRIEKEAPRTVNLVPKIEMAALKIVRKIGKRTEETGKKIKRGDQNQKKKEISNQRKKIGVRKKKRRRGHVIKIRIGKRSAHQKKKILHAVKKKKKLKRSW